MAVYVGTLIQNARVAMPDRSQTLGSPTASVSVVSAIGSTLPTASEYFVIVTQRNQWGETLGSSEETSSAVSSNQGLQITSALIPGATTIRAYFGTSSGGENQFAESTTSPFVISAPGSAGNVPTRNSAYNPDTDGNAVSCGQIYKWTNEGLTRISRVVGGILDYSGVTSIAGQPLYVVTGEWLDIMNCWYDGYWMQGGNPGSFYRRNQVMSSVLNQLAVSVFDDRVVLEVSYQPARTGGTTTTTAAITSTATSVSVANTGAFLLTNGFAQIGTEIVSYSGTSNGQLTGLVRRLGGTFAESWANGTTVNELNLFFQGRRIADFGFVPGNAQTSIPIPSGWSDLLSMYIVARYREAEQDYDEAVKRLQEFERACTAWAANKPVEKHVQVGGSRPTLVYSRTPAGGLILPG